MFQGADAVNRSGRPHAPNREREARCGPARSKTPSTDGTSLRENREISEVARCDGVAAGRVGKAKAVSRR